MDRYSRKIRFIKEIHQHSFNSADSCSTCLPILLHRGFLQMTLRAGWDSPIFGPYFVSGAFVAGCAGVIVAMFFYQKQFKLQSFITDQHLNNMGKLLVLVSLVYVYFNINEIIVPAYKLKGGEAEHLKSMLFGHDASHVLDRTNRWFNTTILTFTYQAHA